MKRKELINPIAALAGHQKVGREDTDAIALPVLIHFDAAHRGKGSAESANFLTRHILIAMTIGSKSGNRAFYDLCGGAYDALRNACNRQTEFLAFTTGEYQAMKRWIGAYFRVMPTCTVMLMNYAAQNAQRICDDLDRQAA